MSGQWQDLCAARKKKQYDSIPKEWLIQLPPDDQLNVMDVPSKCGLLTSRELDITETVDVDVILRKLSTAEWSSVEVTTAFLKRAIVAQQLVRRKSFSLSFVLLNRSQTNCLTEIFVDRALARAKETDDYLRDNGKTMGSLHGLPISLKDQFTMQGLETIMGKHIRDILHIILNLSQGYVSWIGRVATNDCVLVEILYNCGMFI